MIGTLQLSDRLQLATVSSDVSSGLLDDELEPYAATCNVSGTLPTVSNDYASDDNILPMPMEGVHFGDNLRCATINSHGSGEHFAKVEIIVDFAVDESLDIVFVTELKTTLARTQSSSIRHCRFYTWWGAQNVR